MPNVNPDEDENNKNATYRSSRRAARRGRVIKVGRRRQLSVRSELRETPDVHKIARAIIAIAMAEAEREALAQAESEAQDNNESGTEVGAPDLEATEPADE